MSIEADVLSGVVQQGLPLVPKPYRQLSAQLKISEQALVEHLNHYQQQGVIKRFGVVVRHHELGYTANAMTVFDIPDHLVDNIGAQLAKQPKITLCYKRCRIPPMWNYNLFCMIHGKDKTSVLAMIDSIITDHGLGDYPHDVLFSSKRYKQTAANYSQSNNKSTSDHDRESKPAYG